MKAAPEVLLFVLGGAGLVAGGHLVAGAAGSWPVAIAIGAAAGVLLLLGASLARTSRRLDSQEDRMEDRLEALEDRTVRLERMLGSPGSHEASPGQASAVAQPAHPPGEARTIH